MQDIRTAFEKEVKHIDEYMLLLFDIENGAKLSINGNTKNINADLFKVLKANTFLLLYNLLESTVRKSIEHIHLSINQDNIKYKETIVEIQKIWVAYKYENFRKIGTDAMFQTWIDMVEDIIAVEYQDYNKKVKSSGLSGNVNQIVVKNIAQKYKFETNTRVIGNRLNLIKMKRNHLAHGNITFVDCGKDYVYSDLKNIKRETILFLYEFMAKIENYTDNKKYKR
jgi:hypothetical protein